MKTKLLIFGITGDLGTRKLLPALEQIISTGDYDNLSIIGVSRREVNVDELYINCKNKDFLNNKLSIFSMDMTNIIDYQRLKQYIALDTNEQLIVYLAVPPQAVTQIIHNMGQVGINDENVKVLFEKPFGVDYESARNMIDQTSNYYKEDQIYRIDHYLAKEMAQNIVAFRGSNALFSHIWNNNFIESIDIIASEQIGIEGRSNLYDQVGALRDVVQGHLMQLLSLTIMDVPHDFEWDKLPELRLRAINELNIVNVHDVIKGQYDGYKTEVNNNDSLVETFVSLKLYSNNQDWMGVPFNLITGKALDKKTTEIKIHLKKKHDAQSNCLIFRIQPNEGIDIDLFAKKPGYNHKFETHKLSFSYPADTILPDAYEQVIVDAILSRKSLFTSGEEVLRSWEILRPVQNDVIENVIPLIVYPIGSDITNIIG